MADQLDICLAARQRIVGCIGRPITTSQQSGLISQPITAYVSHIIWQPSVVQDWIGLSSVLRPRQHSIGYMGDGFYRSKNPTNSIKVLKEQTVQK